MIRVRLNVNKYLANKNKPKTPAERMREEQRRQAISEFLKEIPGFQFVGMGIFLIGCFAWLYIFYIFFKALA